MKTKYSKTELSFCQGMKAKLIWFSGLYKGTHMEVTICPLEGMSFMDVVYIVDSIPEYDRIRDKKLMRLII